MHYSQACLGRTYIALNRGGNLDPYTETTPAERAELEVIVAELQAAVNPFYQPDIFNYANLRNAWPRCHWHVIPRYKTPRTLQGQTFVGENWGKNYAPYNSDLRISAKLLPIFSTPCRQTFLNQKCIAPSGSKN